MPLILILIYPLSEIAAFIIVGRQIGVFATLALIVASSLAGLSLLRGAGAIAALKLQRREGNPTAILAEGGVRMLAGLLLLIPGFLTDLAAIAVLVPAVRRFMLSFFRGSVTISGKATFSHRSQPDAPPTLIDADFKRLDR